MRLREMGLITGRRVLVTGASGALGTAVTTMLTGNGAQVVGFDVGSQKSPGLLSKYIQEDIRNSSAIRNAVSEVDSVVHLAAWVHRSPKNSSEEAIVYELNQSASEYIAEICACEGKRMVFASTVAVYGSEATGVLCELSPTKPDTAYAKSKLNAEKAVLDANGIVLRLPMIYGVGDKGNMARMISAIAKGWFVIPGKGTARRTFLSTKNAAKAMVLALVVDKPLYRRFIIADTETVTISSLASMIAEYIGVRTPLHVPKSIIGASAVIGGIIQTMTGRPIPLTSNSYNKLVNDLVFDSDRSRRYLGYSDAISIADGLKEEVDWYLRCRS